MNAGEGLSTLPVSCEFHLKGSSLCPQGLPLSLTLLRQAAAAYQAGLLINFLSINSVFGSLF